MKIIQKQCKKQSLPVKDVVAIKPLIEEIAKLCNTPLGRFPAAFAIAHCQVEHDNPLRFFVLANGSAVINPKILERSTPIRNREGCYSYAFRAERKVPRFAYIKVKYTTLDKAGKEIEREEDLSGMMAHIFQHEIDHFNSKSIYS